MNTQKIVEVFQERKRSTKSAKDDLWKIMAWISTQVDSETIHNPVDITVRGTVHSDDGSYHFYVGDDYDDRFNVRLMVKDGECALWILTDVGITDYFGYSEIAYINLADVQKALSALLEKLETFPTRKESAEKLHALAELISE
jgi:hypothetical protein